MNSKKSADYCSLIENVKNKYRKNPIYTKNLTLGWCDLRQGEDLCQEINLKADVIVNTANPNPICASGTDLAIYEAAGKEKLLAETTNIGKIARGDIDSYIDANYVRENHRKEYPVRSRSNARMRGLTEERE